jgi:transcriptional regulator with XRE-family HTH domain
MATKKGPAVPDEVTTFVRQLITSRRERGDTWDKIATEFDVTRTTVIDLEKGSRGVGQEVEQKVANVLYGGSIDRFRRAARGEPTTGSVVEYDANSSLVAVGNLPGWTTAEAEARRVVNLPPRAWYTATLNPEKQRAHREQAERIAEREAKFREQLTDLGLHPIHNAAEWNLRLQELRLRVEGKNAEADNLIASAGLPDGLAKAKVTK